MKEELTQRILNCVIGQVEDLDRLKGDILIILLKDYNVTPAETALAIRDEDKNAWYLQRFLISKTVKGCTENTLRIYKTEVKKALDEIGKNAEDIVADDIRLYLAIKERKCGWTRATCDNALRYLRSFYNYLVTEEILLKIPRSRLTRSRLRKCSGKPSKNSRLKESGVLAKTQKRRQLLSCSFRPDAAFLNLWE